MDHSSHADHIGHSAASSGNIGLLPTVNGEHGSMHAMAFHFGSMETILFKFWMPMSAGGIIVSCGVIIVMCFLMELCRFTRTYRLSQRPPVMDSQIRLEPKVSSFVLVDALLHFVQITLSYCLMLIFMTFNVWLCLAVVSGEVLSRLMFNILFPSLTEQAPMAGDAEWKTEKNRENYSTLRIYGTLFALSAEDFLQWKEKGFFKNDIVLWSNIGVVTLLKQVGVYLAFCDSTWRSPHVPTTLKMRDRYGGSIRSRYPNI